MTPITGDEPINFQLDWGNQGQKMEGLTKLEYFSSRNMSGILSTISGSTSISDTMADNIARESVLCAKALIKSLNEQP